MRCFSIILLCLMIPMLGCGQSVKDSIMHDDKNRIFRVYVPSNFENQEDLPLVFNLHGAGSTASQQEGYSMMNEVADTAGFIVCYPDGIENVWNSGFIADGIDDVGFINALIDVLHEKYKINLNKVYSCGMSNGGFQSLYMACELTDRFAAVACVTGSMSNNLLNNCSPSKPIPVMKIHGTDDDTVPYEGNNSSSPIEDVVQFWVTHNECDEATDTLFVEDIDTTDFCTAQRIDYLNGANNSEVVFYKIIGGGHTWPGAFRFLSERIGVTNYDFNANAEIWKFFNQYSLDTETSINTNFYLDEIMVSPNPFEDQIHIQSNKSIKSLQLFDVHGKLSYEVLVKDKHIAKLIDLSHLSKGIYLLKMLTADKTYTHKIIKNR